MRTLNIIIVVVIMALSFVFSAAEAEAARNNQTCTCVSENGTLFEGCPVHGNSCLGLTQHAHDNMRSRSTSLPLYCSVNGQSGLYTGVATCNQVRQHVREQQREERRIEREVERQERRIEREQQREERAIQNAVRNNPFSRELRRGANNAMSRHARDLSRKIFGR